MAKIPENTIGFRLAVVVEGGLGIVAILLAWMFGIELREQLPTTWPEAGRAVVWGVIATVPLLLGFWWLVRAPTPALRRLRQSVVRMLREVFPQASLPQLALISVLAGVGEELLFRGVLQTLVQQWSTPMVGLAVASLVFGAIHAMSRLYFVLATAVGAYLGGLLLKFDDLTVPIVVHGLYDFVALVYLTRYQEQVETEEEA
jgi:membrane protease YdiL (CAAX protease family)